MNAMISTAQIKYIKSLRMKKFRDQHGVFLAEGEKIVTELLSGKFDIEMICALPAWMNKSSHRIPEGVACHEINLKTLERISTTRSPNQVLAVVRQQNPSLPASFPTGNVVVMLDGINDPGNLGSIIRTADWFGISEVICSPGSADIYNPKVIQATMGSFQRVSCHYHNLEELISDHSGRMTFYGTFMDGENVFKAEKRLPAAIVVGSESHGISPGVAKLLDHRLAVPRAPTSSSQGAESLNASMAAGIVMACFRHL